MKKLILITGILLSTNLWASPMDKVCFIWAEDDLNSFWAIEEYIQENCERNNILMIAASTGSEVFNTADKQMPPMLGSFPYTELVATWCRYDRNLTEEKESGVMSFTCVLYDNKERYWD